MYLRNFKQLLRAAEGGFDEVASHPAVVEAYMGRDPEALTDAGGAAGGAAEGPWGKPVEGAAGETPKGAVEGASE